MSSNSGETNEKSNEIDANSSSNKPALKATAKPFVPSAAAKEFVPSFKPPVQQPQVPQEVYYQQQYEQPVDYQAAYYMHPQYGYQPAYGYMPQYPQQGYGYPVMPMGYPQQPPQQYPKKQYNNNKQMYHNNMGQQPMHQAYYANNNNMMDQQQPNGDAVDHNNSNNNNSNNNNNNSDHNNGQHVAAAVADVTAGVADATLASNKVAAEVAAPVPAETSKQTESTAEKKPEVAPAAPAVVAKSDTVPGMTVDIAATASSAAAAPTATTAAAPASLNKPPTGSSTGVKAPAGGSPRSEWTREKTGGNSGTATGGNTPVGDGKDRWKRGEVLPCTVADMVKRQDGIIRFDKIALILLNKRGKIPPEELKPIYPVHSRTERLPILPKGFNMSLLELDNTPHADEARIFGGDRENAFKYDAARLADASDPAVIARKANLILNKLSVTNFEKLSDEFMAVGLSSDEMMPLAVNMIVQKAQMEEHFCFMYADLCKKMTEKWDLEMDNVGASAATTTASAASAAAAGDDEDGPSTTKSLGKKFRELLLHRCSEEFSVNRKEQLLQIQEMYTEPDVRLEKEIILKKRYTGHMRFIGEIYVKDLVKPKIMQICIGELLESDEEEQLVCLTKLFQTIGAKLEEYDFKKKKNFVAESFEKISVLSNRESFPMRIRFMLKDLMDLRNDRWQARREEAKAKKIGDNSSNNASSTPKTAASGTPRSQDARAAAPTTEWSVVGSAGSAATRKKGFGSGASSSMTVDTSSRFGGAGPGSVRSDGGRGGGSTPSGAGPASTRNSGGNSSGNANAKDSKDKKGGSATNSASSTPSNRNNKQNDKGKPSSFGKFGSKSSDKLSSLGGSSTTSKNDSNNSKETGSNTLSLETIVDESSNADANLVTRSQLSECKDLQRKVKTALEEFFTNNNDEETLMEMKGYTVDAWSEIIKILFSHSAEKKPEVQNKFLKFLELVHSAGLLSSGPAREGILMALEDLSDLAIDVPQAGLNYSKYIASLVTMGVTDCSFFMEFDADSQFVGYYDSPAVIGQMLVNIAGNHAANNATVTAEQAYKTMEGYNLLSKITPMGRETAEDAKAAFIAKYKLTFLH